MVHVIQKIVIFVVTAVLARATSDVRIFSVSGLRCAGCFSSDAESGGDENPAAPNSAVIMPGVQLGAAPRNYYLAHMAHIAQEIYAHSVKVRGAFDIRRY
jgi:hypothetical protein